MVGASALSKTAICIVITLTISASAVQAGQFKTLYTYPAGSWAGPASTLALDPVGNLYGLTTGAPDNSSGAFKLARSGKKRDLSNYVGYAFGPTTQSLLRDSQGNLFGIMFDLNDPDGAIFKTSPEGETTVLHQFRFGPESYNPSSGLLADKVGNFYGTTGDVVRNIPGALYRFAPDGTIAVLHNFDYHTEGEPSGTPIADDHGNLYGLTAQIEGFNNEAYKIAPDGKETVLHVFNFQNGEGNQPAGALVFGKHGDLYGMTQNGGAHNNGTVFKLSQDGQYTPLHSFDGISDGATPIGALVADAKGMFYGMASGGGKFGGGTVFQISPRGELKVLHAFSNHGKRTKGGSSSLTGLTIDAAGNLYGTTMSNAYQNVPGTIFEIEK